MEVDGGEVSLTFSGRTRDSRFDLIIHRSDLVTTRFIDKQIGYTCLLLLCKNSFNINRSVNI